MLPKIKVSLRPIISGINLPTVLKTAILPGESIERIFIATQIGEILYINDGVTNTFLDIKSQILKLENRDERGLIGLAFHPDFHHNGLFYLHYSVAGTQGPGAPYKSFKPDPCDPNTLNLKWEKRETEYDHIDTVEEWNIDNNEPKKRRTILNIRRPFTTHNGFNSLNFSPETGKLILTTGDGGCCYDRFDLSQDNMEIAGKIIEIDTNTYAFAGNPPVVTRFDELPISIQDTLTVIAKGVRNISGISFERIDNYYIKYIGNVGQSLIETIFSFIHYKPIPVKELVNKSEHDLKGFINFGWRSWEGAYPTTLIRECSSNSNLDEKVIAYYDEAVKLSNHRLQPLTYSFHKDIRPDKYRATAITGVRPYMSNKIQGLMGKIVFTDLVERDKSPSRGILAYTNGFGIDNEYSVIDVDYDFGSNSAYYVGLGSDIDQSKLYLCVHSTAEVTDSNQGMIFEIVPYSS